MKYLIDKETGTAYWKENNETAFVPMNIDGTFNTDDSGIVDVWESKEEETRIKNLLK